MPLVTYSVLRLGLLAACFALGYWAGLRTWLLLVVATFAAWGLSYVLLGNAREAAARYVADRVERRDRGSRLPRSVEDEAALEDSLVDQAELDAGQAPGTPPHAHGGGTAPDGYAGETARPSPNSTP